MFDQFLPGNFYFLFGSLNPWFCLHPAAFQQFDTRTRKFFSLDKKWIKEHIILDEAVSVLGIWNRFSNCKADYRSGSFCSSFSTLKLLFILCLSRFLCHCWEFDCLSCLFISFIGCNENVSSNLIWELLFAWKANGLLLACIYFMLDCSFLLRLICYFWMHINVYAVGKSFNDLSCGEWVLLPI